MSGKEHPRSEELWTRDLEARLRSAIKEIRYGSVTLVIQDGHVVQIDKSEKVRLK
ncbi:MAG: YezD family protein [Desulfuromonadales bacterium]|nr:YezD family protein [Desulfuromonadales bacterium]